MKSNMKSFFMLLNTACPVCCLRGFHKAQSSSFCEVPSWQKPTKGCLDSSESGVWRVCGVSCLLLAGWQLAWNTEYLLIPECGDFGSALELCIFPNCVVRMHRFSGRIQISCMKFGGEPMICGIPCPLFFLLDNVIPLS